MFAACILWNKI